MLILRESKCVSNHIILSLQVCWRLCYYRIRTTAKYHGAKANHHIKPVILKEGVRLMLDTRAVDAGKHTRPPPLWVDINVWNVVSFPVKYARFVIVDSSIDLYWMPMSSVVKEEWAIHIQRTRITIRVWSVVWKIELCD